MCHKIQTIILMVMFLMQSSLAMQDLGDLSAQQIGSNREKETPEIPHSIKDRFSLGLLHNLPTSIEKIVIKQGAPGVLCFCIASCINACDDMIE